MKNINIKTWIIALIILLTSQLSNAANVSWNGAVNGNWSDGTKWSGGNAPGVNDTAVITVNGTYTVTMDVNASVAKFVLGGSTGVQTLDASNRTFTLTNNSSINSAGKLYLYSSIINGAVTVSNAGTIAFIYNGAFNSNLNNTGTITASQYSNTITGTVTTSSTSLISVDGATYTADITFSNGFTNNGTIDIKSLVGYNTTLSVTTGALVNAAGANIYSNGPGAGTRNLNAQLSNQGTVTINYPLTIQYASAPHLNNTGSIIIPSGKILTINTGTLNWTGGTMTGAGKLSFTSATVNFNVATIPQVYMDFYSSTIGSTSLPLTSSHKITLIYGNTISAALFNTDTIEVTQYANVMSGALTTASTSVISVDGATYTADFVVSSGFTNNGLIELKSLVGYSISMGITLGNLINAASGVIHSYGPSSGSRTLNTAIDNQGTLTVDYTLTISTTATSSNTGVITMASLQTLTFNGGKLDFNGGSITGLGKLYFNSCNYSVNVSNIPVVFTQFYSSQLSSSLSQINNLATIELIYGNTISANIKNKATGIINVSQYSNVVSGNFSNEAGSLLSVNGATYTADITFNNGFTNNGIIDIKSLVGYNTSLYVTAGEILNLGTIHSYGPSSGSRTLAANLNNQGTLTVDYSLLISKASALHTNTGSVTIASGQTLTFQSGSLRWNGGTLTGTGTLYFNSCTDSVNVANIPNVFTQFYSSQLRSSISQINNLGTIEFIYGNTISANLKNKSTGIINVLQYSNVVSGNFTNEASSLLAVNGAQYTADITFNNGFTNNGTLDLKSLVGYNTSLYITSGILTNSASGVINSTGPSSGSRTLSGQLFNSGILNIAYPITCTSSSFINDVGGIIKGTAQMDISPTRLINNGIISPGSSPGILSINANISNKSTSNWNFEIGGLTAGTQHDKLINNFASQKDSIDGALNISLINGFIPGLGDSVVIETHNLRVGTFATITGQSIPGGLFWNIFYRTNHIALRAGNPPNLNITSSTGANGTISPLGNTSVTYNGTQNYNMLPNTNYHVLDVLVDGISVGAVTSYTFNNVTVNHTISVTFAINTWNIVATTTGSGTISPSGTVVVNQGNNQTFNIAANPCNLIDSVIVDGIYQGTSSSFTFNNVVANHTIKAVFRIAPRITASGATTFCAGGSVTLDAGAGYTNYQWSNSASTQTTNIISSGTYTCTITSTGGCTSSTSVVVTVNPLPVVSFTNPYSVDANHVCVTAGAVGLNGYGSPVGGGFSGVGVSNNGFGNYSFSPSGAGVGSHALTYIYTDGNGCSNSASTNIIGDQNTTANAGIDIILCNNPLANISGVIGGSATSSTWSSNGTGGFANANNLSTTYTLSAADMALGTVTLTLLTNDPANTCGAVSDNLVITYNPDAVADAGPSISCVPSSNVAVSGSISGYPANPHWTTTGTGTFTNANLLSTTYNPSVADLAAQHVYLILTPIDPLGNCTFTADTLDAWFNPNYSVNAGSDVILCGINDTIATINGSSVNATSVTWTSSGSGTFANANNANTTYVLSASDRANGYIQLTLTTNDPTGPCTSVSDFMIVKYKYAIADAGVDVCGDTITSIGGTANANILATSSLNYLWTTTGTGNFANANNSSTTYNASNADLNSGQTKIYFNLVDGAGDCTYGKDSMVIWYNPHYSVSTATDSATFCANAILNISGSSVNALSTTWTTSGTGTFGNANLLSTTYTPGSADTTAGFVTLTLTSNNPNGPCGAVSDAMYVVIHSAPDASAGNNTPICNGTDLNLTASGGTSYSWTGPNGFTSSQQNIVVPNSTVTMSGTYNVVVSNIFGCSNPASTVVIVNPCGCIAPSLLQSHVDVTCFGGSNGSVDLTAVGGSGGNTFLWSNNATTEDVSGLTAGTYTVTVTAAGGCTATLTVTIAQPPPMVVTITPGGSLNICLGNTVSLAASAGASYLWSNGATTQTILIGTAGSYIVTVNNCGVSAPAVVTVTNGPPSSSVIVPPINNLPIYACNGTVVNNINVPSVPGATNYIWDGPAGTTFNSGANPFTNSTPTANITFPSVAQGASGYLIGVQATNVCGSTLRKVQWVRGITSVPFAVVGAATVCGGTTENYSTASVGGATYYTWTAPAGVTINGSASPYTTTSLNVSIYYPIGFTSGSICVAANTPCYTSPFKCIYVSNSAAQPGMMSGVFTVCPNASQTYSVPLQGLGIYTWTLPNNCNGSSTSNSITVNFANNFSNGDICVTYTNQCGEVSSQRCKTISKGSPVMPAAINGATNGVCAQTVVYTCTSSGIGVSYQWTLPAGSSGSSSTNSINSTLPGAGFTTGSICVQSVNACGASSPRCITVKGAPNSPASITTNPSSWCANTSGIEFNADVNNIQGAYSIIWSWPLAAASYVSGQTTSGLMLDWGTGNGNVIVTASNACGAASKTYAVAIGCREAETHNNLQEDLSKPINQKLYIYPNPASNDINIEFESNKAETIYIYLKDMSGRKVYSSSQSVIENYNHTTIDVSKFAKGIYMLSIESSEKTTPVKILIE